MAADPTGAETPRTQSETLRTFDCTEVAMASLLGDAGPFRQRWVRAEDHAAAIARLTERNRALEAALRRIEELVSEELGVRAVLVASRSRPSALLNTIRDYARRALTDTEAPHAER